MSKDELTLEARFLLICSKTIAMRNVSDFMKVDAIKKLVEAYDESVEAITDQSSTQENKGD